jgi:hypothetical protein
VSLPQFCRFTYLLIDKCWLNSLQVEDALLGPHGPPIGDSGQICDSENSSLRKGHGSCFSTAAWETGTIYNSRQL